MFRIGEFSQLAQVTIRTLRHYDELGLLKPAHIDRFTDYRYYTIEQLPRLNRILALKEFGLSLEQIVQLLKEELSAEQLRGMLALKRAEIEQNIQQEQMRLQRVEARLRQIEQEGTVSTYEVVLKKVEPMTIVSMRQLVPSISDMKYYRCGMLKEIYGSLTDQGIKNGAELMLYYNAEYIEQDIDMEVTVAFDSTSRLAFTPPGKMVVRDLPAVQTMASVLHHGSIYDIGQAMTALFSWIGENGYTAYDAYRELHLYWRELDEDVNIDDIIVELQIPVARN